MAFPSFSVLVTEEVGKFLTGKYSYGPSPSDEWFKQGKIVLIFLLVLVRRSDLGLAMGADSQAAADVFRALSVMGLKSQLSSDDELLVIRLWKGLQCYCYSDSRF
ncbi:uncharacterized protein LOC133739986 [Rosa rugosa]|uniref:uncharacterized protein LOC133739986 n=1 Tax=Rosa rugosa TaxID=74645 RepID=UPI002B4104A3|nr:uncharacterized protein LOC133739986 [Rosa rugosa]